MTRRRARRGSLAVLVGVAAVAVGCNAILGIEGASFDPSQPPLGSDGSPTQDGPISTQDGAVGSDVQVDACTSSTLSTDPKNCGACGHDCLGGACVAGRCQAVKLATDTMNGLTTRILVDATHVYWMNEKTFELARIPKNAAPGAAREVLYKGTGTFGNQPALTNDDVAFVGPGGDRIALCKKTGCLDGGVRTVGSGIAPAAFALDPNGKTLWFSDATRFGNVVGPDYTTLTFPPSLMNEQLLVNFAVDVAGLVWTTIGAGNAGRELRSGDGVESTFTLAPFAPAFVSEVALKGNNAYVIVGGQGIYSVSRAGGTPVPVVLGQGYQVGLVVDETHLWFLKGTAPTAVQRCPLVGCKQPEEMAAGFDTPKALAVDATAMYVYVDGQQGGALLRIAR